MHYVYESVGGIPRRVLECTRMTVEYDECERNTLESIRGIQCNMQRARYILAVMN